MTPANEPCVSNELQRPGADALQAQLSTWLQQDAQRLNALQVCCEVLNHFNIGDWYIAAGFVRNLVWDKLHHIRSQALNDIDVIYWCDSDVSVERDRAIEAKLRQQADLPWSVKNQARMHLRNNDPAYLSCLDAMSYWPEKQTAVGVKLVNTSPAVAAHINQKMPFTGSNSATVLAHDYEIKVDAVFGLACLFSLSLHANPKRDISVFKSRVIQKKWLLQYPKLIMITEPFLSSK